jgi:hypothetical protein
MSSNIDNIIPIIYEETRTAGRRMILNAYSITTGNAAKRKGRGNKQLAYVPLRMEF